MLLDELCPYHFPSKSSSNPHAIPDVCLFQEDYDHCPFVHLSDMMSSSDRWKEYLSSKKEAVLSKPANLNHYFLTMTRNPKVTRSDWFDVLCHTLRSKQISIVRMSIEHLDANVHVHAHVTSKNNLSKDKFKAYCQKHRMHIQKVTQDNGIEYYLKKENDVYDNLEEFISENKKNI